MYYLGAISVDGLSQELNAIIQKCHQWKQSEQLAVLDVINQYWCLSDDKRADVFMKVSRYS